MIKIVKVTPAADRRLSLIFSDGSRGEIDLSPLIARDTALTAPLADEHFRHGCFLELGALCWPNGLELSAGSLHQQLERAGELQTIVQAA